MSFDFSLNSVEPLTFKIDGPTIIHDQNNNVLPSYLVKDMIVKLVSGVWPLVDYNDCNKHTFVFQKPDGSQFSMLLNGFSWQCCENTETQKKLLEEGSIGNIYLSEIVSPN
jgi:hypothetical protein